MVELIAVARCRKGGGTFVEYQGRELAVFVFTDPERVFVVDNACPHSSGNLSGGGVAADIVTCPSHQWRFELATGRCTESHKANVRTYPAELRHGVVWADLGS